MGGQKLSPIGAPETKIGLKVEKLAVDSAGYSCHIVGPPKKVKKARRAIWSAVTQAIRFK